MAKNAYGFTIVELLIVIVVIGVLAAIAVVAYSGITDRARYVSMNSDILNIKKAIELYHADNGNYPDSDDCVATSGEWNYQHQWCGWHQGVNDSFIPGLAPKYMATVSNLPKNNGDSRDTYLYKSASSATGQHIGTAQYQLIRYKSTGLSQAEIESAPLLGGDYETPTYGHVAWGVKSHSDTPWW